MFFYSVFMIIDITSTILIIGTIGIIVAVIVIVVIGVISCKLFCM